MRLLNTTLGNFQSAILVIFVPALTSRTVGKISAGRDSNGGVAISLVETSGGIWKQLDPPPAPVVEPPGRNSSRCLTLYFVLIILSLNATVRKGWPGGQEL